MAKFPLPVPVLEFPHWRVNYRPGAYVPELIPSLADCFSLVEQTRLHLRGWDYPHLSQRSNERTQGKSWIASWSDYEGHYEFWRLYQSGQFLYLGSIREVTEASWKAEIKRVSRAHLSHVEGIDWENIPGFISIINFIYTTTEIFEFAARLCQKGIYRGNVTISIELSGIKGLALTTERNRLWYSYYAATVDELTHEWQARSDALVASSPEIAIKAVSWFFERFGWMDQPLGLFKKDQENLLKGRP